MRTMRQRMRGCRRRRCPVWGEGWVGGRFGEIGVDFATRKCEIADFHTFHMCLARATSRRGGSRQTTLLDDARHRATAFNNTDVHTHTHTHTRPLTHTPGGAPPPAPRSAASAL
jgi:hypothetical protein